MSALPLGLFGLSFLDAFGFGLFRDPLFDRLRFLGLRLDGRCIAHNKSLDGLHERLFCHDNFLDVSGEARCGADHGAPPYSFLFTG
jgi:hypothetical protein